MLKQARLQNYFSKVIDNALLSHAYVIVGDSASGKEALVTWVAQSVFCLDTAQRPCQHCANCQRIASGQMSDVVSIFPDGQTLKVDQIREVKANDAFSSIENTKKIYVIHQGDKMSVSASNSLLKMIEEPVAHRHFFLLCENKNALLPTILSRVQLLTCERPTRETVQNELQLIGFSVVESYLLSHVVPDSQVAKDWQEEGISTFIEQLVTFGKALLRGDSRAFVMVQRYVIPAMTNREWASVGLQMLMVMIADGIKGNVLGQYTTVLHLEKTILTTEAFDHLERAKGMLASNVSVQNCYEWVALQMNKQVENG